MASVSSAFVAYLVWGLSCFCFLCYLTLYHGLLRQRWHIITQIYCAYLALHTIASIVVMASKQAHNGDSVAYNYVFRVLLALAAAVYMCLALIWTFAKPIHNDRNSNNDSSFRILAIAETRKHIKRGLIILMVCLVVFYICLGVIPESYTNILLFVWYLPCALWAYVCLIVLHRRWRNISTLCGVIGGTFGMIDFLYPAFVFLGAPGGYTTLWTRVLDAIFYVPLATIALVWLDSRAEYQNMVDLLFDDNYAHNLDQHCIS